MSTYLPTVDYLMRTANMTALKLRVDGDPRAEGGTWRSVIGDPNGRVFGSPGDALLGIGTNPQIWFKFSGDHTSFGWGPLDASGLAAAVALLQTQVAQLQTDLTALQAQVNANTLAISNLQTDIANLTALVVALNAAVVALGLQVTAVSNAPFVEFGAVDPSTPNARALTTTPTILIATLNPGEITAAVRTDSIDNTLLANMPANTIKSNPTGVAADPQDLPVGASTVVGRGPAGDIVAAQLVTSQIANNQVDNTKAADMPATSVKVNPTGVAGDPQDLVAATDGFLEALAGQIIWSPLIQITRVNHTVYEVDFSTLASTTFVNGAGAANILDGKQWTGFSVAAAGTFDILTGTGLRWIPAVSVSGVFNETNQTAAGLYIDLFTLIGASFHPGKRYSFEFHYSARTLNASTRIGPFLWGPAGDPTGQVSRVRGGGVNNSAGTQVAFAQQTSTATNGTEDVSAQDVFAITVEPLGTNFASSGTFGATWPTNMAQQVFTTTNFLVNAPTANRPNSRLAITHSHLAQNPVVDTVVLHDLRVVEL